MHARGFAGRDQKNKSSSAPGVCGPHQCTMNREQACVQPFPCSKATVLALKNLVGKQANGPSANKLESHTQPLRAALITMTSLSSRRWADITDGDDEAASLARQAASRRDALSPCKCLQASPWDFEAFKKDYLATRRSR